MKISDAGIALIQRFEQCRLTAYMPTPNDVPTIGWGTTEGVSMGDTCTQAEADAWLKEDVADAEKCVNSAVSVPLRQEEFDSLCSLTYNIGCTAFRNSTLLRKLNNNDLDGASLEFMRWVKQSGKTLNGLVRRRKAEMALFESTTGTDVA